MIGTQPEGPLSRVANLMSWLAPQNDMLAEDWTVADSAKEIVK